MKKLLIDYWPGALAGFVTVTAYMDYGISLWTCFGICLVVSIANAVRLVYRDRKEQA